jgi:hypothetical protein
MGRHRLLYDFSLAWTCSGSASFICLPASIYTDSGGLDYPHSFPWDKYFSTVISFRTHDCTTRLHVI